MDINKEMMQLSLQNIIAGRTAVSAKGVCDNADLRILVSQAGVVYSVLMDNGILDKYLTGFLVAGAGEEAMYSTLSQLVMLGMEIEYDMLSTHGRRIS